MKTTKHIKSCLIISIITIFVSINFVWAQSSLDVPLPSQETSWFETRLGMVAGCGKGHKCFYANNMEECFVTELAKDGIKISGFYDSRHEQKYVCAACGCELLGIYIKTDINNADYLAKIGFTPINYDPTVTTTKPVTTTKSVLNTVARTGVVVDKDLNIVVIQTPKAVNVLQRFLR